MRDVLKWCARRWRASWLLPLVLLALPNCAFHTHGLGGDDAFDPGDQPLSSAIMCDIPKVPVPGASDCASPAEVAAGMSIEHAAVALAQGEVPVSLALDWSEAATIPCNGSPKKIEMHGPFPDGMTVCLNCGQVLPTKYHGDANEACIAKCIDVIDNNLPEPPGGSKAFCEANAKVSTNFDKHTCFANACTPAGSPVMPPFKDPRREQEKVKWTDSMGDATFVENDLSKLTGTGTPADPFDSGAASEQKIAHGDAWVEFSAKETGVSHVLGISHDDGGNDTEPGLADIGFAISLNFDGNIYVLENGATIISQPLGTYNPGDRFRIRIQDNNNGTATITYTRISGNCSPGTMCSETTLPVTASASPKYPLRVDASFREPGATLSNVTMVRIQDLP